ncbi:hypothetical protein [Marivirga lumbricoides]|uniref:hypothetical protein n=1 Tax=Marivirga lumbricoides TaxID=1046115 RepID=UPI001667FF0D
MPARSIISITLIILFVAKLIAIDGRSITKLSTNEEIVLTKPLCKKKIAATLLENTASELSAKEIHLLTIDNFCNNLLEVSFFNWDDKVIIVNSQYNSLFFTNLSTRYLTYHSPPPQS